MVDRLSPAAVLGRLRAHGSRLQRSVVAQKPVVRWSMATAAVSLAIGLSAAGYWAVASLSAVRGRFYLVSGRSFCSDDLVKICRSLDKQRLAYRIDDERRIEVTADQFDRSAEVVAKLDLGQRSIDDIRNRTTPWNVFEPKDEREAKKQRDREQILERLISELDGVKCALVSINRPRAPAWGQAAVNPSAFVYIETEGDHRLSYQTLQAIPMIVSGYESDVTPASITVMDRRGTSYFDAGNLSVGDQSRNRAREEQIAEEIHEALSWIKGVRVQVQVTFPHSAEDMPAAIETGPSVTSAVPIKETDLPKPSNPTAHRGGDNAHRAAANSRPAMRVNKPLLLEPERKLQASDTTSGFVDAEAPLAAGAGHVQPYHTSPPKGPARRGLAESGHVLIYVPRSFYINADLRGADREPSREELLVMRERTERQIRTAVKYVIPDGSSWKVDVDSIPDEVSLNRPAILPASDDSRRCVLDWGIVGAVGAAVSILAAVGSWIQLVRRPVRVPEPALGTRRFHADFASEPQPSERVRELIRRNPEAAASVLQRWTYQGGESQ